ncbi:LysR family transcriptional regulator [Tetragenococcus halophilus subsp. flandriensis]|uniref:LysR family transcriptional regulator n=1 Tax=Tetragenococcus halophilus TaxID=51669 RepID=UPI0023E948D4|nr:LysR family transcriptional regulator [Tetragenococcus halophilus]GMA08690.1 LysR family transcriptional regulator [Tetragenococcus halophilus subsp. flandriensis]
MDIRSLKYFLTVAQEESITGAAKQLHLTQPNLSRQLKTLEQETGKKLFYRGSRKMTLTDEGLFLKKRAEEIIELLERTETDITSFDETVHGEVFIGAAETHAMRLIAHEIQTLREKFPQILYHFFSGSTKEVTEQLDKGLLNFGILVDPIDPQKFEHIKLPTVDTWGVLMREDSPLAKLEVIRPEDIRNKPLLCSRQMLDVNDISDWLGEDINQLNIVFTFNFITNPAIMIEEGIGYAFTFDKLINTSGDSRLCFRPLEPKFETGLYLVWKKDQLFTKAAQTFLEQMKSSFTKN